MDERKTSQKLIIKKYYSIISQRKAQKNDNNKILSKTVQYNKTALLEYLC